jgi:hypothetical protein
MRIVSPVKLFLAIKRGTVRYWIQKSTSMAVLTSDEFGREHGARRDHRGRR